MALPAHVWHAHQLASLSSPAIPSGFPRLNLELPGGGWPIGSLTELIARDSGIGELRLLIPVLRQLTQERKIVILLAPPHVPYAPALASFNINLDYLMVIQAPNAADRLWAVEQTLKSACFGALLAWMPENKTKPEHLRRLQLAAQTAQGPVFLFRQLAAQYQASPAALRLQLIARANQKISVTLLKRRGPVLSTPLLLDLPEPITSIRLKPSQFAEHASEQTTEQALPSMHLAHVRPLAPLHH
jgi:protein ImuA